MFQRVWESEFDFDPGLFPYFVSHASSFDEHRLGGRVSKLCEGFPRFPMLPDVFELQEARKAGLKKAEDGKNALEPASLQSSREGARLRKRKQERTAGHLCQNSDFSRRRRKRGESPTHRYLPASLALKWSAATAQQLLEWAEQGEQLLEKSRRVVEFLEDEIR